VSNESTGLTSCETQFGLSSYMVVEPSVQAREPPAMYFVPFGGSRNGTKSKNYIPTLSLLRPWVSLGPGMSLNPWNLAWPDRPQSHWSLYRL